VGAGCATGTRTIRRGAGALATSLFGTGTSAVATGVAGGLCCVPLRLCTISGIDISGLRSKLAGITAWTDATGISAGATAAAVGLPSLLARPSAKKPANTTHTATTPIEGQPSAR
jgi:hypothetical protein